MAPLPSQLIPVEEHAVFPSLPWSTHPFYATFFQNFPAYDAKLRDHAAGRLADMQQGHVTRQILSHLPGTATAATGTPAACAAANDEMAAAMAAAPPGKFACFAALPMAYPDAAARELERCVREIKGFVGAMVDNHLLDGTHYEGKRFWCVWEMAERLDVPVYIHPAPAPAEWLDHARPEGRFGSAEYSHIAAMGLSGGHWGWHENVGLHILKLYAAGVFKRFPNLKVIIGHNGEMLPMMVDRVDGSRFYRQAGLGGFGDIWERNIWVTTSGMFSIRSLRMLREVVPMSRVMYGVDTPFNGSDRGFEFVKEVAESGSFSEEEMQDWGWRTASRLLKLENV